MAYAIESGGTSLCRAREALNQSFPSGRVGSFADAQLLRHKPLALDVDADTALPPLGGRVSVGVPRRGMARAALVVFGLPLAAMTAATVGFEALGGAGAAGAALGLLAGGAAALAWGRSGRLAAWVRPRLVAPRATGS